MSEINLYKEMNDKIGDFLLGCTDNGMLIYAGMYIKELENQLAEYRQLERSRIMKKADQAKIILKELNKEYSVPSYMEDDVIRGIIKALSIIEKKEERGE